MNQSKLINGPESFESNLFIVPACVLHVLALVLHVLALLPAIFLTMYYSYYPGAITVALLLLDCHCNTRVKGDAEKETSVS